jgi:hypothetical protein
MALRLEQPENTFDPIRDNFDPGENSSLVKDFQFAKQELQRLSSKGGRARHVIR